MSSEEIIPASSAPQDSTSKPEEDPSASASFAAADPSSAEPTEEKTSGEKQRPASSPVRKIARPAKARSSMPGGSSKKGGAASKGGASQPIKSYSPGDIVLARLKGFPAWPGRITDPSRVSADVLKSRPSTKPYIYCVEFFPAGDFAWINANEIKSLTPSDIEAYISEPHRKVSSSLREAYLTAQDPTEWDEAQVGYRKAKEEAAAAAAEEVDELEDDDDAPSGGKRKRAAEKKTKAKKPKAAKKSAAEVESEEEAPKSKKAAPASKAPASKAPDSKPVDDDPLASDPECIKVKDWRHKLQRGFLGKSLPEASEMAHYDDIFKTIEGHKGMTIDALSYSKIGKVMKKIAVLEGIPKNDEYKFTDRASKLMHSWQEFIDKKGVANGNHADANGDAPSKSDAPTAAATEDVKMAEDKSGGSESKEEPAAETKPEGAEAAGPNGE
ncbi:hypothetical protein BD324DRAFT_611299 [Kockovaella imperatae]|uniref:PWWP domain-containing protein n=1 Tax=Kockovaella imperatae TaxID=4999 RepID=A0A1Y1UT07_9TREE|nr:hypothetical protein BD324DRAFT_611299 [Kockovaella imperatae]ORX40566.1 hypothetical protein BD324DRAFT_611299 [Kockovaella imperatae]